MELNSRCRGAIKFAFFTPLYDFRIDTTLVRRQWFDNHSPFLYNGNAYIMSTTVTVSPKYQIVIPQEVREAMKIRPGQKVMFMEWRGAYVIVPVMGPDEAFGLLKGQEIRVEREKSEGQK